MSDQHKVSSMQRWTSIIHQANEKTAADIAKFHADVQRREIEDAAELVAWRKARNRNSNENLMIMLFVVACAVGLLMLIAK